MALAFNQKTVLKNIAPQDVIQCFHSPKFIMFLTTGQPVKIRGWSGIKNSQKAAFSFWFFGWRKMSVVHENYNCSEDFLSFEDIGLILPFGLKNWKHKHIVKAHKLGAVIIDKIYIDNEKSLKTFFIYPIMLFPIIIRKITYKIWFYFLEGKLWTSIKRRKSSEI